MSSPARLLRVSRALVAPLLAAALLSGAAPAASAATSTCVALVASVTGATSTTLSWGSATIPLVVKTNAELGYRLAVTVVSVTNGTLIGIGDIGIGLTTSAAGGTVSSSPPTAVATSPVRTPSTGDTIKVRLSTWQPLGSPTVRISYTLTPRTSTTCS